MKTLPVVIQQGRILEPQLMGTQQQFGKIQQSGTLAQCLVGGINLQLRLQVGIIAVFNMLRTPALVLAAVDKPLQLFWWPLRLVQFQRLYGPLDQPQLVLGVQNLKALRQTGLLPMAAQQPMRQPVKGADPHTGYRCLDHLLDTAAHFTRRLVGKGHREYGVGRQTLGIDQPGNPVYQHPRLATARTGEHQQGIGGRTHCLALRSVQWINNS